LRPGDPREVVLRFFVRPLDEVRLEYDRATRRQEAGR
jgi:hypothetical protein